MILGEEYLDVPLSTLPLCAAGNICYYIQLGCFSARLAV